MLVPSSRLDEVAEIAKSVEPNLTVGDPTTSVQLGPVVSEAQFDKIQGLIERAIADGATPVIGGPAARRASRPATTSSRRSSPMSPTTWRSPAPRRSAR